MTRFIKDGIFLILFDVFELINSLFIFSKLIIHMLSKVLIFLVFLHSELFLFVFKPGLHLSLFLDSVLEVFVELALLTSKGLVMFRLHSRKLQRILTLNGFNSFAEGDVLLLLFPSELQ